ncbi:hypothetical protein BSFA1_61050 (plasmid) [Burkholderia sp. SFA1]|nr:PD-(D/E)XK nuclease family protein [Caballeronia sp. PC1]MCE4545626.1 PD-(D/E)XK nuclease family protein [Caballeronia sp. PC1]BBQ00977.1 hypothetical protein BSFA1_61050 [Burkholderia sp. SFA1]
MSGSDSEALLPVNKLSLSALFEQYDAFDKKRESQKDQGENDYSLLRSVFRRLSDEVDLHSRFLCSMLDPSGPHYRRGAFGEAFMSLLGYPGWLDWATAQVRREHECIDIYMTDGRRHVLIENKIHAVDQPGQVRRYIDQIRNLDGQMDADDLLFVYLSNGRSGPTAKSLKPYELCTTPLATYVVNDAGQRVARFVNAHYLTHVLPWTTMCLASVENIRNLHNAFSEYRGVVQRITRTYKSRVMSLEDFLLEDSPELNSRSRVRLAFDIARMLPAIKADWLAKMFEGLDDLLDEEVRNGRLVPIAAEHSVALQPLHFERDHASSFFPRDGRRSIKNKGRFWRIATGPAGDVAALVILFGAKNLHIGLLPIRCGAREDIEFSASALPDEFKLGVEGQVFEFERHRGINKWMRGLVSWMVPLDTEIEHLSHFKDSRVALLVNALVKHALDGNVSFRPTAEIANEGLPR